LRRIFFFFFFRFSFSFFFFCLHALQILDVGHSPDGKNLPDHRVGEFTARTLLEYVNVRLLGL